MVIAAMSQQNNAWPQPKGRWNAVLNRKAKSNAPYYQGGDRRLAASLRIFLAASGQSVGPHLHQTPSQRRNVGRSTLSFGSCAWVAFAKTRKAALGDATPKATLKGIEVQVLAIKAVLSELEQLVVHQNLRNKGDESPPTERGRYSCRSRAQ